MSILGRCTFILFKRKVDSAAGVLAYYILGGLSCCSRIFAEIEGEVALLVKDFVSGLVYSLFL